MHPNKTVFRLLLYVISLMSIYMFSGCATVPYRYAQDIEKQDTLKLRPGEPQIVRGRPEPFIDGLGHYLLSLPSKLILWNWQIDNHDISEETEKKMGQYLEENGLKNVKVRLNQYSPGDEWRRLFKNKSINLTWRILLGIPSVTLYTIFPERVFAGLIGGDHYNPFTNTINLYSGHTAVALHESGHAKDVNSRKYKGAYSALGILPFVPLYTEAIATGDAIGYLKDKKQFGDEKESYKVLYPAYSTYIGGEITNWIPAWIGYAIEAGLVIPAHIIGRIKASTIDAPSVPEPPQ